MRPRIRTLSGFGYATKDVLDMMPRARLCWLTLLNLTTSQSDLRAKHRAGGWGVFKVIQEERSLWRRRLGALSHGAGSTGSGSGF